MVVRTEMAMSLDRKTLLTLYTSNHATTLSKFTQFICNVAGAIYSNRDMNQKYLCILLGYGQI